MMEQLRNSRWVYILLSLVLAIVFWMYVRIEVDPEDSTTIHNVPVELTGTNVLTGQGLTVTGISAETVDLRVSATVSVINNLIRYCSTTYPNGIKRAFLRQPSRGFYFGDNSAFEGGGVYIHPDPTLKDRPGFRHANACNALFFDGHASRVSSGKFPLKSMNAQAENTSFWKNWAPKDWNAEAEKIFAH